MKLLRNIFITLALLASVGAMPTQALGAQVLLNNTYSKLTGSVTVGATTITVTPGDGVKFAAATGGNTIRATLVRISGFKEIAWEIVDITARSTDTLTITRAREGTSALAFSIGDLLDVRMTAGMATINKVTITGPATGATLTIADGKTFTASNTLTLTATDGSTLAIGAGGTLGTGAYATISGYAPLASPTFTGTPASTTAAVDTNTTQIATTAYVVGQGYAKLVSPAFTTPSLGVASATSLNKVTITTPATSATLTIANGKTLTASNTLTFTATDGSTLAIGAGGTLGTGAYATIANYAPLASPAFTTPSLGAATATSINGNTFTTGTYTLTGTAAKTLTFSNTLTLAGTDSTTMTFPSVSSNVGYLEIPQNSQSASYTTVLADSGKHLYHPSADTTARTFTIAANASVAYPIGTAITFVNDTSGGVITIAINSDTLVFAGTGATGSRSLAASGVATAIKITATRWIISGTNLT